MTNAHNLGEQPCPCYAGYATPESATHYASCGACGGSGVVTVMTRDELRERLLAQGYTHYQSMNKRLPLSQWCPYGNAGPEGVNYNERHRLWLGFFDANGRVVDYPDDGRLLEGFMLGVWTFHKTPGRFEISSVHGESKTVFHVVDTLASPRDQPAIVESHDSLTVAQRAMIALNKVSDESESQHA